MSVKSETDSSSSSSDDDYPPDINEEFEKSFFKTLSSLKTDDPSIYDKEKKFFDDLSSDVPARSKLKKSKQSKSNPLTLLVHDDEEDDNVPKSDLPYTIEQQRLKESFKSLVNDSDDDDDLLLPSKKTEEDIKKEEADYIQWLKGQKQEISDKTTENNLKNLRDYWNSSNLNEDEEFLRDYILNKRFLDKDDSADDDELSEDSETLEAQENFEQEYNFRYETGDNLVRRFPRNVDNSLRRKNTKRSEKRAKIKERKQIEKTKKKDEINRQKKIKAKEIAERLEKLKELTGNEKLAFNDNDIIEDFNPEEHDKKMSEMFNDEYYQLEDKEKPALDDLDFNNDVDEEYYDFDEKFDEETDAGTSSRKERKKTRTKRKKERKKKSFNDIAAIEKPVYDPKLHESYQKYMDEYYELDCEDFIYDMPCRFKYKQVEANDFGLSVEEILAADDKELNSWSSIKKITKIRSAHVEKNEVKIYKQKAQNELLKRKILPSLYKVDEEEISFEDNETKLDKRSKKKKNVNNSEETSDAVINDVESAEASNSSEPHVSINQKPNKHKNKKRKIDDVDSLPEECQTHPNQLPEVSSEINDNKFNSNENDQSTSSSNKNSYKKSNKFNKGYKFKKNHDFHDSRLSAYGINPKKFKVKS